MIVSFIFSFITDFLSPIFITDFLSPIFSNGSVSIVLSGSSCSVTAGPALLAPDAEYIRDAASGALTDIDQVEHLQHRPVAGIGHAAALCRVELNAEAAGVGHGDAVPLFEDDQPLPAIIIRIDKAVGQCQGMA